MAVQLGPRLASKDIASAVHSLPLYLFVCPVVTRSGYVSHAALSLCSMPSSVFALLHQAPSPIAIAVSDKGVAVRPSASSQAGDANPSRKSGKALRIKMPQLRMNPNFTDRLVGQRAALAGNLSSDIAHTQSCLILEVVKKRRKGGGGGWRNSLTRFVLVHSRTSLLFLYSPPHRHLLSVFCVLSLPRLSAGNGCINAACGGDASEAS